MREYIASMVLDTWERTRATDPTRTGRIFASIPCPPNLTLNDIPHIAGCTRIEVMLSHECQYGNDCTEPLCILHQPIGLVFYTEVK